MTDTKTGMAAFKARLSKLKVEMPPEERTAKDKDYAKRIQDPGVYEVTASAEFVPSKTPGRPDNLVVHVETAAGQKNDIYYWFWDKDMKPSPIKLQRLLRGFGITMNQNTLSQVFSDPECLSLLPALVRGKSVVSMKYYGYNPWYVEKGVVAIADFSMKGVMPPANLVKDPVNGDLLSEENTNKVLALMESKGLKKGGQEWEFLKPADDFELTPEQIEAQEAISDFLCAGVDAPPPEKQEPPKQEAVKPKTPVFLMNRR